MKISKILISILLFSLTLTLATPLVKAGNGTDPEDFDAALDEMDSEVDDGALDEEGAYNGLTDDSQDPAEDVDPCDSPANLSPEQKLECLFPNEQALIEESPQGDQGTTSLPYGDLMTDFLPFFINTALAITGTLIFVALLYGGYLFVMANDNEESINKGKKIMIYSVIGALVVAISYAVVYGIANLGLD